MEQHAVPQDITGFKFKLVGDMTLKQFGELAAGAILAYLFYASGWNPLLKWPFVILFGILGIALAFIPIEERPLDLWIINFLRAIYKPTLYIWKKEASGSYLASVTTKPPVQRPTVQPIEEPTVAAWPFPKEEEKTVAAPKPAPEPEITETPAPPDVPQPTVPQPTISVDQLQKLREEKMAELEKAKVQLTEVTKQAKEEAFKTQIAPGAVTVEELAKMREQKLSQQNTELKSKVAVGETELNELIGQNKALLAQIEDIKKQIGSLTGVDTTELSKKLEDLNNQKAGLSTKINALSDQLAAIRAEPLSPPEYQPRTAPTAVPGVRVVNKPIGHAATISLSSQPNIISGMVVTGSGAPVEGVIILIKDKAGNSIRALKTNKLGQFVVATPMENGMYYVELEKEGYKFNVLEVSLSGQVLAPLEIPATTA